MPARPRFPLDILVGGARRHVIKATTTTWVEQTATAVVVHVGKLLLDGQEGSKVLAAPKSCTKCKRPSWAATVRGRARHDACEGWTSVLTDEHYAAVVFGIAADLGAQFVTPIAPTGSDPASTKEKTHVRHAA